MEVILGSYQILAMLWFVSCRVAHGFYFFNELIVIMHQIHNWEEEKIRWIGVFNLYYTPEFPREFFQCHCQLPVFIYSDLIGLGWNLVLLLTKRLPCCADVQLCLRIMVSEHLWYPSKCQTVFSVSMQNAFFFFSLARCLEKGVLFQLK